MKLLVLIFLNDKSFIFEETLMKSYKKGVQIQILTPLISSKYNLHATNLRNLIKKTEQEKAQPTEKYIFKYRMPSLFTV